MSSTRRWDRIDPQAGRVVRAVAVGSSPRGIAVAGSGVWVAARAFAAASHRGGTLDRSEHPWLPKTDPTQAVRADRSGSPLATVYDGLVALRRSGGAAGLALVPDLAVGAAAPGRRRHDLHVHAPPGNPLLQRRAERCGRPTSAWVSSGRSPWASYPGYYQDILGAQVCQRQPKRCDLSAGIITDDTAGTVTFRLRPGGPRLPLQARGGALRRSSGTRRSGASCHQPGPTVPARHRPLQDLAIPAGRILYPRAEPVFPPMVVRRAASRLPLCHPYRTCGQHGRAAIGGYRRPRRSSRTQQQRSVSRDAVPGPSAHHPHNVYYISVSSTPASRRLRTSRPGKPSTTPSIARRCSKLFGLAPGQAAPTCQILPADFPAHHSYCPYTTGTKDGDWHGPDTAKALRLVREIPRHKHAGDRLDLQGLRRMGLWAPTSSGCSKISDTGQTCTPCPLTSSPRRPATSTARPR